MLLLNAIFLLLFSMPGGGELIIILVVVLLLFGGKKIPELMRGLGKGIREFNDAKSNVTKELEEGLKEKDVTSSNVTSSSNGTPASTSTSTRH
jgi:sec-independent protein translocase protein TatA